MRILKEVMTLKGKREKGTASATPPLGEAIKSALEKVKASLSPLVERVQPYWQPCRNYTEPRFQYWVRCWWCFFYGHP